MRTEEYTFYLLPRPIVKVVFVYLQSQYKILHVGAGVFAENTSHGHDHAGGTEPAL
jgi:hypothetical protein